MNATYQIKTDIFEGPLDLLLSLIEKRKLFINDISLAQVADDYIAHVRGLSHLPVSDTAHFLLIASTLVLIKSKSLLPSLALSEDEQGNIENLEARLRAYQRIKEASRNISERFGKRILFARNAPRYAEPVFSPDKETTKGGLLSAIRRVLANLPQKEIIPETIVRKIVSLEEMIDNLAKRIQASLKMSFNEFSKMGKTDRVNVVVSFLAMLELVKQGAIEVVQDRHFADIKMESRDVGVPRYN